MHFAFMALIALTKKGSATSATSAKCKTEFKKMNTAH
jgi:hypothetical protein